MVEERIADQIVTSAFEQQLGAYRYLQTPNTMLLGEFRTRGQEAYGEIRKYLFFDMPLSSRLKVEAIKETHEEFEVAAQHAFDLALGGEPSVARAPRGPERARGGAPARGPRVHRRTPAPGPTVARPSEAALQRLRGATSAVALALACHLPAGRSPSASRDVAARRSVGGGAPIGQRRRAGARCAAAVSRVPTVGGQLRRHVGQDSRVARGDPGEKPGADAHARRAAARATGARSAREAQRHGRNARGVGARVEQPPCWHPRLR